MAYIYTVEVFNHGTGKREYCHSYAYPERNDDSAIHNVTEAMEQLFCDLDNYHLYLTVFESNMLGKHQIKCEYQKNIPSSYSYRHYMGKDRNCWNLTKTYN